jgi:hypothetical protein
MTSGTYALFDAAQMAMESVASAHGTIEALNETETRAHLIDPVIAALGYVRREHLRRELKLEASGQFVDYLLSAGDNRIVVEAKPVGTELSAKDAGQLVGYCAQEGIRWALLTNGANWQVFDLDVRGNWQAKRVADVDLWRAHRRGELAEPVELLRKFARETLAVGDEELQAWARAERARALLHSLISNAASPVVQAVMREMSSAGLDLEPSEVVQLLAPGRAQVAPPPSPVSEQKTLSLPNIVPPMPEAVRVDGRDFFIFPVGPEGGSSAEEVLKGMLSLSIWGVRRTSPNRGRISAGDRCCFYVPKVGVVAHATITGPADRELAAEDRPPELAATAREFVRFPLDSVEWLGVPVPVDAELRASLDAFRGKDPTKPWAWLVQSTNRVSEHDFRLLIGEAAP